MVYLESKMSIYQAQEVQMVLLLAKEVRLLKEYIDFLEVFSKESTTVLLDYLDIIKNVINLE